MSGRLSWCSLPPRGSCRHTGHRACTRVTLTCVVNPTLILLAHGGALDGTSGTLLALLLLLHPAVRVSSSGCTTRASTSRRSRQAVVARLEEALSTDVLKKIVGECKAGGTRKLDERLLVPFLDPHIESWIPGWVTAKSQVRS